MPRRKTEATRGRTFPPFLSLRAYSPPPTLDVNRATRAVSRSGNRPEVPPYSPARRAIVHQATRAVRARPVSGPLISFFISFRLVRDRARILRLLIVSAIVVSYRIVSYRIVSSRVSRSVSLVPVRTSHTHTLSLSLSLSCALAFPFGIATRLGSPSPNSALHYYHER